MARTTQTSPFFVIYGDEEHQKQTVIEQALDTLLPPEVDRALALTTFDTSQKEDQGGPTITRVLEDLTTLPFLADRRVVVIRDADSFISANRDKLETYAASPAPTGVLILECRSFPKTTRFSKAVVAAGGELTECKKLFGRAVAEFVVAEAEKQGKRIDGAAAQRIIDMVGQDTGVLAGEIEKLCLYAADRPAITNDDVTALVGQSREEKVFAAAEAAAIGNLQQALKLWRQVLETDPAAAFRAVGGFVYVVRRWLTAHRLRDEGLSPGEIAPRVQMWRRDRDLSRILQVQPARRLRQALAAIADLDSQAKVGARSIDKGVETLLTRLAAAAR